LTREAELKKKIILKIEDMHCSNCVMILERIEDKLDGVLTAEASYHKGQMVVEYDEDKLEVEQIKAEILRMGYHVSGITEKER
jgi:copper chaperone CopZ